MPVAIGAFFAIDAIIIALVLTLWFIATIAMLKPIVQFLANAAGDIPVIGGWLAGEFTDLENYIAQWIQNTISNAYRAGASPFINMMTTYANAKSGELYSQKLFNARITAQTIRALSHATGSVNQPTQTYVNNSSTVNNTYVLANTDAAVTQSEQYTQASYGVLADWANTAVQIVYSDVVDADGRIARLSSDTSANIATALDTARGYADAAQQNAVLVSEDYTKTSFTVLEGYVQDTQTWARGEIDKSQAATEDFVTTHEKALHDSVTAEMTATAAIATAVAADFADFMKNCGDPLCGGLTDLAKGFMGMKDLLGTALLLGFIEEAIREPERTADATVAVADVITSPAKAIISSIFG